MDTPAMAIALFSALIAITCIVMNAINEQSLLQPTNGPTNEIKYRYGIILDAGSTGSRIHVYKFKKNSDSEMLYLEDELFLEEKPGLSSFTDPNKAAYSLKPLIDASLSYIPSEYHSTVRITLQATAGLRLMGDEQANNILMAVRKFLKEYPYQLSDDPKSVSIISGTEEGVWGWISVNYLLGRLGGKSKQSTVAIMDLGGGSTQIVYEPHNDAFSNYNHVPSQLLYELKFGGHSYYLQENSYLRYGLIEARKRIKKVWIDLESDKDDVSNDARRDDAEGSGEEEIDHPCLPAHFSEIIEIKHEIRPSSNNTKRYKIRGKKDKDEHLFHRCLNGTKKLFDKHARCEKNPCSFDGVFQYPIHLSFNDKIYAFSYFYDRTLDILLKSESEHSIALQQFYHWAKQICLYPHPHEYSENNHNFYSELIQKNPHLCMDLTYIYVLLSHGYDIPNHLQLQVTKKINEREASWCLGAMLLQLMDGDW